MKNKQKESVKNNVIIKMQKLKDKLETEIEIISETKEEEKVAERIVVLHQVLNYTDNSLVNLLSILPEIKE